MSGSHSAKTVWNYKLRGCCAIGRPRKRWREKFNGVGMGQNGPSPCG